MGNHLDWGSTQERGSKVWIESWDLLFLRLKGEEEKMRKEWWSGRTLPWMALGLGHGIFFSLSVIYILFILPQFIHISSHKNIKLILKIYFYYKSYSIRIIWARVHFKYYIYNIWAERSELYLAEKYPRWLILFIIDAIWASGSNLNQSRTFLIYIHLCKI